jgi:hypothetical protein
MVRKYEIYLNTLGRSRISKTIESKKEAQVNMASGLRTRSKIMSEEIKIEICLEAGKITVKINGEPFHPMGAGKTELEPTVPEKEKGNLIHRRKTIGIWEKPLAEIMAQPLLKSNMFVVLKSYYPNAKDKTILSYVHEYCTHLGDNGYLVIKEKRRYKSRSPRVKKIRIEDEQKGVCLEKSKPVYTFSKPLEELKSKVNLTYKEATEILKKYHPNVSNASMATYVRMYLKKLPSFDVITKPRRKSFQRKGIKSKIYKLRVTPEMIDVVTKGLVSPSTSKELQGRTGLSVSKVMATLDVLRNSGTVKRAFVDQGVVHYILQKPSTPTKPPVQKTLPVEPIILMNDITEQLSEDYDVVFKKDAIQELSQFLNSQKQNIRTAILKQSFRILLQNHQQVDSWKPYIEYFVKAGKLEKQGWGHYKVKN